MQRWKPIFAPLAVLGVIGAAHGQEAEPTELEAVQVRSGVPASGDPLLQAPQVDVLSGPEKERQEAASIGETLAEMPGVDSIGAGRSVGKPVIRGLSGNRVRILSGGVGLDHQQYGTRHTPNIDPFLSERVEVVRGASSLLYGSDALGGAVNVQPMPVPFAPAGESVFSGQALTRYASNNDQWDLGLKAETATDRFGLVAGVMDRSGGDITTPDADTAFESGDSDDPAYTGALDFTDFDQTNAVLGGGMRGDWGDVQIHYTRWRNEHNFLLPPPAGNEPPEVEEGVGQALEDDRLRLAGTFPLASDWELAPKLMWQNNRRRSNGGANPRSALFDGAIDVEFDQYTARLEAEHGMLGVFDSGTLGLETVRKDQESRGTTQLAPGGDVTKAGLFAYEERGFGPWLFQGGLRYDYHRVVADEDATASVASPALQGAGRTGETYNVATGSLGGSYSFSRHLTLAANIGRGFRAPTLFELYAHGVHAGVAAEQRGNPDLDPEKSIDSDLSLRWRSSRLEASATVYRNRINDYIFLRDTGGQTGGDTPIFRYDQADAVLTGLDLAAEGEPVPWLALAASASIVEGENTDTDRNLPLLPANKVRGSVTYQPEGGDSVDEPYVELGVRHAFAQQAAPNEPFAQFDSAPFGTASTDPYTLVDLSAGFGWQGPMARPIRFDLEVRNLLDEDYRAFLDTYKGYALSPGRDIRATVRVPFGG